MCLLIPVGITLAALALISAAPQTAGIVLVGLALAPFALPFLNKAK